MTVDWCEILVASEMWCDKDSKISSRFANMNLHISPHNCPIDQSSVPYESLCAKVTVHMYCQTSEKETTMKETAKIKFVCVCSTGRNFFNFEYYITKKPVELQC